LAEEEVSYEKKMAMLVSKSGTNDLRPVALGLAQLADAVRGVQKAGESLQKPLQEVVDALSWLKP